jgi:hypothetical protein
MRRICGAFLPLVALFLFQSTSTSAFVKFDFEQKYFNEPGQNVLDHFMLEENGVYHLFYLRGNPALSVGHAISTDLTHWTHEPPVLSPGTWDAYLWAPSLFPSPSGQGHYMFYTGVNTVFSQQTGVAFSSDLYDWSKFPANPVYHPDPVWAKWSESSWANGRDPHVIEYEGQYYLFNTAMTWPGFGAIACAVSSDLLNWTDIGPVYVHYTWHVLESIFVMERNNRFHMFFTEEVVNGTSHMWSDSLLSDWNLIATRSIIDLGHAPQVSFLDDGTEIFSRHAIYNDNQGLQMYNIRLDTLRWNGGDTPLIWKPFPLSKNWTVISGTAFTFQPTFRNNPYARFEEVDDTFVGDSWIGTKERYSGPLGFGTPGSAAGESPVGVMRSKPFTVTGYSISLRVGGTNDADSCYVALVDDATGSIIYKETGKGVEEMDERLWNLQPLVGNVVYVEIVDNSGAGHINVDHIVERADPVAVPQGNGKGKKDRETLPGGAAQFHRDNVELGNSPNPFNPTTTISFELEAPARVALDVFDVSGQLVDRLLDERRVAGVHRVDWHGTDRLGRALPSGVYFYRVTLDGSAVATRKMVLLK